MNGMSNFKPIRTIISQFFYQFAKTLLVSKMRYYGRIIAALHDFFAILASWLLTGFLLIAGISINFHRPIFNWNNWHAVLISLLLITPPQVFLFRFFGLYRGFWRFASIQDLKKILCTSAMGGVASYFILNVKFYSIASTIHHLPFLTSLLYSLFLVVFLSAGRLFVRFAKDYKHLYGEFERVIIVGAGNAGEGLVRDLLRDKSHHYKPIIFVDDDLRKLGREIHGIRVAGTITKLPELITKHAIDLVFIAIPSANSANMRSVVAVCEKVKIRCYTLPGIKDLANGLVSINVLRSISLEDLLGRYPVTCQWDEVNHFLKDKTILVTGGGGSIGSELCRQLLELCDISRLIVLDNNEFNLYSIEMEIRKNFPECEFYPLLQSITDRIGIQKLFKHYCPDVIFHAAAYKHVPLLEHQPRSAIFNNIIGTKIIAEEALIANVEKFVLISSDKAVNPTNVMGATKRAAEYFCQNLNDYAHKTQFITVRFGNVLDSAGSVIPLFRKQIETGGPVTVTHPDIIRFFMTIPEASQLILQAALLGQGGEIFVLDMGDPIKIRYLAEQMIKLAGKIVDKDIKIVYTGLRPGEKLYEECFYTNEALQPTTHSKILRAKFQQRNFTEIQQLCNKLIDLYNFNGNIENELIPLLKCLVPEYTINSNAIKIEA